MTRPLLDRQAFEHGAMMALLSLAAVLVGCGGSSTTSSTVSSEPVAMVLRPAETDRARLVASNAAAAPSAVWQNHSLPWLSPFTTDPCTVPSPSCSEVEVTVNGPGSERQAEQLKLSPGDDPTDRLADSFYLPVNGFPAAPDRAPPVLRFAAGGDTSRAVSAAVTADGRVWTWGTNSGSEMAASGQFEQPMPGLVDHGLRDIVAIDVGSDNDGDGAHVLALAADGSVYTWGLVVALPVTNVVRVERLAVPALVPLPFTDTIAVAAGSLFSLALRPDGSVWAWGFNGVGRLGRTGGSGGPEQVSGIDGVVAISAGARHALALRRDGSVWAWGSNEFGESGDIGSALARAVPRRVVGMGTASAIDAGVDYSIAVRSDGTVWSWGRNDANQLGRASTRLCGGVACDDTPGRVGTGFDQVLEVAAGGRFALARRNDGSVWAWGSNEYGQIAGLPGLGTAEPVRVLNLAPALNIAAGARHALAMPLDTVCSVSNSRVGGRLVAWGDNLTGERGDGTSVNALRPTPVLTLGDSALCAPQLGERLFVYLGGPGKGTVQSDQPGLQCSGILCWQTVSTGTTVTLSASADNPNEPAEWRWDCAPGSGSSAAIAMSQVRHCKLRFGPPTAQPPGTPQSASLTVDVSVGGRVTSTPAGLDCAPTQSCVQSFPQGTALQLVATPDSGFQFSGFGGDPVCAAAFTLNAPTHCTASFTANPATNGYRLTVTKTGPAAGNGTVTTVQAATGIDCGTDCTEVYAPGTAVVLRAAVVGDFFFSHWTGCDDFTTDDEGNQQCVLIMRSDRDVQADFE